MQVVECLPREFEFLSSIPNPTKKEKEEEAEEEEKVL
jgi:hypothetical protein